MRLRLGTRGSELARTQSRHVADALAGLGHDVELVVIRSEGDVTSGSLRDAGGLGLFAATLRRALLDGEVDLAVHSLKDLPTAEVPGLVIAATPERELPFDALCARDGLTLAELPALSRVGTGSPRRAAQLRARRPDLAVVEIRGNVGTRLARVHGDATTGGDLDAVVLARAGLARLGRFDAVTDVLDLLPAPGQGALAVECRADDIATRAAVSALDDAETRLCVTAERTLLAELEAGCAAPVGAYGHVVNGHLEFTAVVLNADGSASVTVRRTEPLPVDPAAVGRDAARELLERGAADVTPLGAARESRLEEFHDHALWAPGTEPALVGRRVLLPRPDGPLAQAVRAAGAEVVAVPLTEALPLPFELPAAPADWVVLTSAVGVRVLAEAGVSVPDLGRRVAAVGRATASALEGAGVRVDLVPSGRSDADALVAALPDGPGLVLLPGSALASPRLVDGLRDKGWDVAPVATYTTVTRPVLPAELADGWAGFDAVVVTAGSTARAVLDLLGPPPAGVRVIAFGRPSAAEASALGWEVAAIAATQDGPGVVDALVEALEEER